MKKPASPALEALLSGVIDYAGMFPPSTLPCATALDKYSQYRRGPHAWMLRWFVVGADDLDKVPQELDGALSVLAEADDPRAAALETKRIVTAPKPVYCEVPIKDLDEVKRAGCYAKVRTGGVKPEAIPSIDDVAGFILACAERRLAFKATAGLHHPVRATQPLTYEANAPTGVMHGFLNVFLAAAFAWHGDTAIEPILAETDPAAFRFNEWAHWKDKSLGAEQVRQARTQFIHAFGSCSFEEPVQDLERMGLL
jgi:hypothetical protein